MVDKLNRVDYKVEVGRKKYKVLHINNLKKFWERELEVMRLVVVADDCDEDEAVRVTMQGDCADFDVAEIVQLQEEFPDVFDARPGRTGVCQLEIHTGEAQPIASTPYRVPERLKEGVRHEIDKLLELGVVVESTSPWASPIVPVPKPDGSLRLCIDYRRLNAVSVADLYYMCTLDEILERVGNSGCITKLDLFTKLK